MLAVAPTTAAMAKRSSPAGPPSTSINQTFDFGVTADGVWSLLAEAPVPAY